MLRKVGTILMMTISCMAGPAKLVAAERATFTPTVVYYAWGDFASPPVSGQDRFRLAGQPFTMIIVANVSTAPACNGKLWAQYNGLVMTGTVQSAFMGIPVIMRSQSTTITLATGNPYVDFFEMSTPVVVMGMPLNISAQVSMPKGTMPSAHIQPLAQPVILTPTTALAAYSDGASSTTLGINGTMNSMWGYSGGTAGILKSMAGALLPAR